MTGMCLKLPLVHEVRRVADLSSGDSVTGFAGHEVRPPFAYLDVPGHDLEQHVALGDDADEAAEW